MMTRTADFAKDANPVHRRSEILQDYQTVQSKILGEQEKNTVKKTQEAEQARVQPDGEGPGSSYHGSGKRGGNDDEEQPPDQNELILRQLRDADRTIDIKI